jgi:hypothetical protein
MSTLPPKADIHQREWQTALCHFLTHAVRQWRCTRLQSAILPASDEGVDFVTMGDYREFVLGVYPACCAQ